MKYRRKLPTKRPHQTRRDDFLRRFKGLDISPTDQGFTVGKTTVAYRHATASRPLPGQDSWQWRGLQGLKKPPRASWVLLEGEGKGNLLWRVFIVELKELLKHVRGNRAFGIPMKENRAKRPLAKFLWENAFSDHVKIHSKFHEWLRKAGTQD